MNADTLGTIFISAGCFVFGIAMLILCTELAVLSPILSITGFVAVGLGITIAEEG